jgi:hypothetical protein
LIDILPTTRGEVLPSPPPPQDATKSVAPARAKVLRQVARIPGTARRIPYLRIVGTHLLRIPGQCVKRQLRALLCGRYIQVVKPRKTFLIAIP